MPRKKPGPKTAAGKKRSLSNLRPPWQKGQSGNEKGRPRGSSLSSILRLMCDAPVKTFPLIERQAKEQGLVLTPDTTLGEVIDQTILIGAIAGNDRKIEILLDRVEGKVVQKIEQKVEGRHDITQLNRALEDAVDDDE